MFYKSTDAQNNPHFHFKLKQVFGSKLSTNRATTMMNTKTKLTMMPLHTNNDFKIAMCINDFSLLLSKVCPLVKSEIHHSWQLDVVFGVCSASILFTKKAKAEVN